MKISHRGDHHPHSHDEREPRSINRPESYGGYADSGDDDYPAAQQRNMRAYSGHAQPRPSGERPGDPAGYARGYSRAHTPGWADSPQDFRGHGPRRTAPSDEEVLDRICERLACDTDLDASEIEVSVQGGLAVLAGSVPSRQAKRDASAIAESTRGVREVENRLHVSDQDTAVY